jgi:hypothetical protein
MTRINQLLIGAFAVQLLLVVGIYFSNQSPAVEQQHRTILSAGDRVNRIVIAKREGKQAVLQKIDGKWLLPDYHQLIANQYKVTNALNILAKTKIGWPAATTASGRKRFEVSDDNYQIRIILSDGDNIVQQFYLGTSPGFRQVHLRKANQDEVYAVKLNSYDFQAESLQWLDKTLARPVGKITGLIGSDFTLTKQDDNWKTEGIEGELVKEEFDKLLNTLNSLNVQEAVVGKRADPIYRLTVKTDKGDISYNFFSEGNNHYLSRDGFEQAFKISKYDYDNIVSQTAEKLVKQNERRQVQK